MLREFTNLDQRREARRWFESDALELIIWYDRAQTVSGFQIIYPRGTGLRALTWRPRAGFAHSRVDEGDGTALKNCTPVLTPDGQVAWPHVIRMFERESADLEPTLRDLVLGEMRKASGP